MTEIQKKYDYGMFGFILNLAYQKSSETSQESSQTATIGLVEYMDDYHRVLRPLMHQALPDKMVEIFNGKTQNEIHNWVLTLIKKESPLSGDFFI